MKPSKKHLKVGVFVCFLLDKDGVDCCLMCFSPRNQQIRTDYLFTPFASLVEAKIELAAEMTSKRHRMSLHKAAEITDMAGTFKNSDCLMGRMGVIRYL